MSPSLPDQNQLASPAVANAAVASPAAALYVVATPIGHLDDLTERARHVLTTVQWVACEDTRTSRVLLNHLGSGAHTLAHHQHNERASSRGLIEKILNGQSVALISDAGTPAISDPGANLVAAAHEAGVNVIPIPGASALTSLLSVCGFNAEQGIYFAGFLPASASKRRARLQVLNGQAGIVVVYEAPHRITECLQDMLSTFGEQRQIVIAREMTKRFEQIVSLNLGEAVTWCASSENHQRGEFALALAPSQVSDQAAQTIGMDDLLRHLLEEMPTSAAAKICHKLLKVPREQAYERAMALSTGHQKRLT